jgi:hypothetical protein
MTNILGLLGLVLFIALIIGIAALVTWAVVKLSPMKTPEKQPPAPSA